MATSVLHKSHINSCRLHQRSLYGSGVIQSPLLAEYSPLLTALNTDEANDLDRLLVTRGIVW